MAVVGLVVIRTTRANTENAFIKFSDEWVGDAHVTKYGISKECVVTERSLFSPPFFLPEHKVRCGVRGERETAAQPCACAQVGAHHRHSLMRELHSSDGTSPNSKLWIQLSTAQKKKMMIPFYCHPSSSTLPSGNWPHPSAYPPHPPLSLSLSHPSSNACTRWSR